MYDGAGYQPLPNFEQPTSEAGTSNLYLRKRLDTQHSYSPPSPGANVALEAR